MTSASWNCEVLYGYEKYTCQIDTHCQKYKPKHITFQTQNFEENIQTSWEDLDIYALSKQRYRDNQNGIYSCSIIKVQQNTLWMVKNKLLKVDKSGTLASTIKNKIDLKITKLRSLAKQKKCKITDKESIYTKKDLLIESSYQLCTYNFYLEYSSQHYKNIANSLQINQSYIDYENNLPVHILLELIKQDFIVYRQKLHQTLSPLNQVVYKIANAMSIH